MRAVGRMCLVALASCWHSMEGKEVCRSHVNCCIGCCLENTIESEGEDGSLKVKCGIDPIEPIKVGRAVVLTSALPWR